MKFGTWNVEGQSGIDGERLGRLLEFLSDLDVDVLALQEVPESCWGRFRRDLIGRSKPFAWGKHAAGKGGAGSAVLGRVGFRPGTPRPLAGAPDPQRGLILGVRSSLEGGFTVASVSIVPGARGRNRWGPGPKRQNYIALADWLRKSERRTVMGIDANSPEVDHPAIIRNIYFRDAQGKVDQAEHLLHDSAEHVLSDALRVYLRKHPRAFAQARSRFERIRAEAPESEREKAGCLAVSHVISGWGYRRRFDFIYITPDLEPDRIEYRVETLRTQVDPEITPLRLSNHALVVATLRSGMRP